MNLINTNSGLATFEIVAYCAIGIFVISIAIYQLSVARHLEHIRLLSLSLIGSFIVLINYVVPPSIELQAIAEQSTTLLNTKHNYVFIGFLGYYILQFYLLMFVNRHIIYSLNAFDVRMPFLSIISPHRTQNYWLKIHFLLGGLQIALFVAYQISSSYQQSLQLEFYLFMHLMMIYYSICTFSSLLLIQSSETLKDDLKWFNFLIIAVGVGRILESVNEIVVMQCAHAIYITNLIGSFRIIEAFSFLAVSISSLITTQKALKRIEMQCKLDIEKAKPKLQQTVTIPNFDDQPMPEKRQFSFNGQLKK